MKVALITNWKEHCGVSEYAVNLVSHLARDVEHTIVSKPLTFEHIQAASRNADILHFNYCSYAFKDIKLEEWARFRDGGKKLLLTFHDSSTSMIQKLSSSKIFDKIVAHEKPDGDYFGVVYIPQGLSLGRAPNSRVRRRRLGIVGCPFPWKGFQQVALIAYKLEMEFLGLLSASDSDAERLDVGEIRDHLETICPNSLIKVGWQPYSLMVRDLSECTALAFPYDEKTELYGISSAVRCGMAARRPVIVSRSSQFKDLFEYEDEVYFTDEGLEQTVIQVIADIQMGKERIPNRILVDMSWERCARLYLDVYKELYDSVKNNA